MTQIKKLTLKLKSGLLSELHSDTVMGHFCWRLRDKYGDDIVKEFISLFYNSNVIPPFIITNGLLEKNNELFFPKPFIHLKKSEHNREQKSKKEKMIDFLLNKDMKSIELLTNEQFNLAINGNIDDLYANLLNDKLERPKFITDLKVSIEIDRNSLSSREGQLFSSHPKFLGEDTHIVFLLKILNEKAFNDFECEKILKDVFEIGFGKKKSSGFGQFEVVNNIEDFNKIQEPQDPNAFIILGNYLPSSNDCLKTDNKYDFIVKYGRLGEEKSLSENPFKKPVVLFTPGGVFKTEKIKDYYGIVTQDGHISEFDLDVVHFGMPFILKYKL